MVKFADEAVIEVSSGKGGNGCIAFRREKYVPHGGPAGGDGGRGGDLVFEIRRNLRTLVHLRFKHHFKAKTGGDGQGSKRYGKDGEDCVIPLPPGTLLRDAETGEIIRDFGLETEGRYVFLKGGNGGWGNVHFKTSTNQSPRHALSGQPAQVRKLKVELNIIADIGFVGFPNAGKSSLLDYFTNARPKIAPYPFTTKIPNLGVLRVDDVQDIILADIPGIIEGASEGLGLGIRFLKHISRSVGLAFIIDLGDDDFLNSYDKLQVELENFSPEIAGKDRVILANKLDLDGAKDRFEELRLRYPDQKIYGISVHHRWGLDEVRDSFIGMVNTALEQKEESIITDPILSASVMPVQPEDENFMLADLTSDVHQEVEEEGFGATVSLNRKRKGKRK